MDNFIVVVDKLEDWKPYYPTDQIITVKDYLFDEKYQNQKGLQVVNLCCQLNYLSLGYYCSLIAEARKHKVIPNLKTINDLSKKSLYLYDMDEISQAVEKYSHKWSSSLNGMKFRLYFGKTLLPEFQDLARKIFEYYPAPVLEIELKFKGIWQITSISPLGLKNVGKEEEDIFSSSLDQYSSKIWRLPKNRKIYSYDLAILVDPEEELPPSNGEALKKFVKACEKNGLYCELITRKEFSRISEFDALFIRETTSIKDHTYRFAKVAESEGLVVVDDPTSILKCTNKIFLANLLERIGISGIPGRFVSDAKKETLNHLIEEFGLPLVIKIPDGSFSIGVEKAESKVELEKSLQKMLKRSDLVLVQKFLYTDHDWRIGVLDKKPFFACKYFMSENHWQIYNHRVDQDSDEFSGDSVTMKVEQAPKKVVQTAVKAASAIGNGLYGVDLKEDAEGNVYVVEINDNPNIDNEIEDAALGDELYQKLVEWFIKEIKLKKSRN